MWFNQSTLQVASENSIIPAPKIQFPFLRIAGTSINTTATVSSTYLYHQLSDTVFAEHLWDGTSGFWVSNNISIATTAITSPTGFGAPSSPTFAG